MTIQRSQQAALTQPQPSPRFLQFIIMGQSPAMQPPPSPSPSPRRRGTTRALLRLLFLVALSLAALLAFVTSTPSSSAFSPARRALQLVPPRRHRQPLTTLLRAVRRDEDDEPARPTSPVAPRVVDSDSDLDAVLLPDWEVLVLLRPGADDDDAPSGNTTCAFPGGATSPARSLGRMPTSGRRAFTCAMPRPERRLSRPFRAPRVVATAMLSSSAADGEDAAPAAAEARSLMPEMMRWSGRLVYDSAALASGGDVLVFAKGVNARQGVNRDAADIRCIYYRRSDATGNGDRDVVASLPAATSAQQVFRCPPPPPSNATTASPAEAQQLRVTLAVAGEDPIPSVATYTPPPTQDVTTTTTTKKKLICACTMVRDVAKFLREWVVYHTAVGIDRFYLYDNGSGDDMDDQVRQLSAEGFHVSTHAWPWPKTQEAGFSYAAAAHRDSCEWMAFIDVDEFIFSPDWAGSGKPTKSMLRSVVTSVKPNIGQVTLGCKDFGPSGRTKHPKDGVTQGYTCRRRAEQRHKSLVRLDSVAPSLMNSVHHFELQPEFKWERSRDARVNHYKFQAWDEFKVKFRRRVSTYVADWTDRVNHGSKDRTPGLGFEAVEPAGWPHKFCEVKDTLLRDVTRRWFGVGFTNKLAHQRPVGGTAHSSS